MLAKLATIKLGADGARQHFEALFGRPAVAKTRRHCSVLNAARAHYFLFKSPCSVHSPY